MKYQLWLCPDGKYFMSHGNIRTLSDIYAGLMDDYCFGFSYHNNHPYDALVYESDTVEGLFDFI